MPYAMGSWDFVDSDTPEIVHRYTGERLVRSGKLGDGLAPPGEDWFRFDYKSTGLNYPLAVRWSPERGQIVIDHNRSAELARQSGAGEEYPRWGAYARVDDLVADALWCWPGVVDIALTQMRNIVPHFDRERDRAGTACAGEPLLAIFRVGGYANREWRENFVIEDVLDLTRCRLRGEAWSGALFSSFAGREACWNLTDTAKFWTEYGQAVQTRNRLLLSPSCVRPAPYEYAGRACLKPDEVERQRKRIWPIGGPVPPGEGSRWPAMLVHDLPPYVTAGNDSVVAIVGDEVPRGHSTTRYWKLDSMNGTRRCLSPQLRATLHRNRYVGGPFAGPRCAVALLTVGFRGVGDGELTLGITSNCFSIPLYEAAPILIRDMVDALLSWRDVGSLMDDRPYSRWWSKPDGEVPDRFDVVAITSRFLGGRPVWTRGQIAYFC
jgi:hypothetical protein